ncbi:uncharacterized protein LOC141670860 isoform X2 [Apium graveolens]|uniref:uncharacterized protein LOC141670860 isoform X2 n=1 Tax=Apium graveolens TaxID=4045 RepID=UPI003D7ADE93
MFDRTHIWTSTNGINFSTSCHPRIPYRISILLVLITLFIWITGAILKRSFCSLVLYLRRSVRARRSVVVTGYHSDSSDIKEKVPRKHPLGRCSKKKLKYSAFEQDQQLQEPVLVTNDVIGVVEDLEPMRTILSIFGARDIVRIRLNDEEI